MPKTLRCAGTHPLSLWRKNQIWKGMETRKVRKSAAGWLMATPERPSRPGSSTMSGTDKSPLRQEASRVAAGKFTVFGRVTPAQ